MLVSDTCLVAGGCSTAGGAGAVEFERSSTAFTLVRLRPQPAHQRRRRHHPAKRRHDRPCQMSQGAACTPAESEPGRNGIRTSLPPRARGPRPAASHVSPERSSAEDRSSICSVSSTARMRRGPSRNDHVLADPAPRCAASDLPWATHPGHGALGVTPSGHRGHCSYPSRCLRAAAREAAQAGHARPAASSACQNSQHGCSGPRSSAVQAGAPQ
jgi:hypothetical protein